MQPDLERYDFILEGEDESHGYLNNWKQTSETPWALLVEEQSTPKNIVPDQEDENYGFRDLDDAWRASFTNFKGGEGQLRRDVTGGSGSKFYRSNLIDIETDGEIKLQHTLKLVRNAANFNAITGQCTISYRGLVVTALAPDYNAGRMWQIIGYDPMLDKKGVWCVAATGRPSSGVNNANYVTCMTTDGQWLYVAYAGAGVYAYRYTPNTNGTMGSWTEVDVSVWAGGDCGSVEAMCFSGGYLYMATANNLHRAISGNPSATMQMNPIAISNDSQSTFGVAAIGTWIYWGIASESETRVYRTQYNVGTSTVSFEQFAELPTGFVGTALESYLSNLYICGFYVSNHLDLGQGAIFLATDDGLARLCVIGDDPNEVPTESITDDHYTQIIGAHAYDHFLYVLTARDLYRWDIRNGGLAHVANTGVFGLKGGAEYQYQTGTTPVPYPAGILPGVPWTGTTWFNLLPHNNGTAGNGMNWSNPNSNCIQFKGDVNITNTKSSDWYYQCCESPPDSTDTYGSWANGGTLNFTAGYFNGFALEVGIRTTRGIAHVVFAEHPTDKTAYQVFYYRGGGNMDWLSARLPGRLMAHSFALTTYADGHAQFFVDGQAIFYWTMPVNEILKVQDIPNTPGTTGFYVGMGDMATRCLSAQWRIGDIARSWQAVVYNIYWTATQYAPIYEEGKILSPRTFTVMGNAPWIATPIAPTADDKGLMTLDLENFPKTYWDALQPLNEDPAKVSYHGWLETSETTVKLPTVQKFITYLDVHHAPLNANERIVVTVYVDDIPHVMAIYPNIAKPHMTSVPLTGKGYKFKMRYDLYGPGMTTPALYGASLRFSPRDNVYFQFYVNLRDDVRDKGGLTEGRKEARDFLLSQATTNSTVRLRFGEETHLVQLKQMQFTSSPTDPEKDNFPQGNAIVKMKLINTISTSIVDDTLIDPVLYYDPNQPTMDPNFKPWEDNNGGGSGGGDPMYG